jgi:hypothetical protein
MNIFQLFHRKKPGEHRIRYIVKGTADDYNVTFKSSDGSKVVQEPHIRKGWKYNFKGRTGDYFYVAVQSNRPHSEVDVFIYEDGKLMKKEVKTGDYPVVQVSDLVH